jgi:hypothetical protein
VEKRATLKRTALSGWLNKVDGADVMVSVDEVDDTMVGVITVEMVGDTTLAVMEVKLGHHRSIPTWQKCKPTWQKCKPKLCSWDLRRSRRRKPRANMSLSNKVSQKTADWQFLVETRM